MCLLFILLLLLIMWFSWVVAKIVFAAILCFWLIAVATFIGYTAILVNFALVRRHLAAHPQIKTTIITAAKQDKNSQINQGMVTFYAVIVAILGVYSAFHFFSWATFIVLSLIAVAMDWLARSCQKTHDLLAKTADEKITALYATLTKVTRYTWMGTVAIALSILAALFLK